MLRSFLVGLAFLSVASVLACGSASETNDAGPSNGATNANGNGGLDTKPPDENGCCPRDPGPSGCMYLGGYASHGSCSEACDFFCSENWRVVKDDHGCESWRYDIRSPGPPDGTMCSGFPPDAGVDADGDARSDATGDANPDATIPE